MKVAIISKSDSSGGGASHVAEDLCRGLRTEGYVTHHYHAGSVIEPEGGSRPLYGFMQLLLKKAHGIFRKIGLGGLIPFELPFLLFAIRQEKYDIIHFHDLSSAISPLTLQYLAKRMIVIWTFHDCSPFTGGCLYPMECKKYQSNCFPCRKRGEWPIDSYLDLMFIDRWFKSKLHGYDNIELLAPSKWMSNMAVGSNMFLRTPRVISNGVNVNIYKPLNNNQIEEMKRTLGIGKDQPVLLILAASLADKRKGIFYSLSLIEAIVELNPFIILIGKEDEKIKEKLIGISHVIVGYVSDERKLNEYYNMSDLFLNCTLADNQPLVVLETMAAGIPTVGFKIGGIPEMVVQGKTGYLVEEKNMLELEKVLRESIANKTYMAWGKNARKRVEENYTHEIFLKEHLECYKSLLENKSRYD